ncbi:DUF4214 domain-containing protein [Paenibacillus sp. NPDC056579]|uniref:DUF4214 domain-containing protein n=1 Tax=Paenibacillus sp. NPDC056579 TaxID=3345871 RepID=UPI0036BF9E04
MDIFQLRIRNNYYQTLLFQGGFKRIIEILYPIFHLGNEDFIWEVYRQLLKREPDAAGYYTHLSSLAASMSKAEVVASIIQSEEAEHLYQQPVPPEQAGSPDRILIADHMQRLYGYNEFHFIYALYYELLGRKPDLPGLDSHIYHLNRGLSRGKLFKSFLISAECIGALSSPYPPMTHEPPPASLAPITHLMNRRNKSAGKGFIFRHGTTRVGFYLGYPMRISLDGEGIGRFIARLLEGLLLHSEDVVIDVVCFEMNYSHLVETLGKFAAQFPNRLFIHAFQDIEWVNNHVHVDAWIIPYVGLESALQLQKPIILCLHDMVHLHFKEMYYDKNPQWCMEIERVASAMAGKAEAVLFQSEFTRNNEGLRFLQIPSHKTHVVRFAPPIEEYHAIGTYDESLFRQKYNLYDEYIVFPSVIRLHKNHERLIEAFLYFKASNRENRTRLFLTDDYVHRPNSAEIAAILRRYPDLQGSIIFSQNRMPIYDVPSLYKYAKGTIVPTLFEGAIPFPILESLLMGTQVSVSKIGVTQEVVPDMEPFIPFDPYNVYEMSIAIYRLIYSHSSLAAIQASALSSSLQRTWSDVARDYYKVIKSIRRR